MRDAEGIDLLPLETFCKSVVKQEYLDPGGHMPGRFLMMFDLRIELIGEVLLFEN